MGEYDYSEDEMQKIDKREAKMHAQQKDVARTSEAIQTIEKEPPARPLAQRVRESEIPKPLAKAGGGFLSSLMPSKKTLRSVPLREMEKRQRLQSAPLRQQRAELKLKEREMSLRERQAQLQPRKFGQLPSGREMLEEESGGVMSKLNDKFGHIVGRSNLPSTQPTGSSGYLPSLQGNGQYGVPSILPLPADGGSPIRMFLDSGNISVPSPVQRPGEIREQNIGQRIWSGLQFGENRFAGLLGGSSMSPRSNPQPAVVNRFSGIFSPSGNPTNGKTASVNRFPMFLSRLNTQPKRFARRR